MTSEDLNMLLGVNMVHEFFRQGGIDDWFTVMFEEIHQHMHTHTQADSLSVSMGVERKLLTGLCGHFAPGVANTWKHRFECILSYKCLNSGCSKPSWPFHQYFSTASFSKQAGPCQTWRGPSKFGEELLQICFQIGICMESFVCTVKTSEPVVWVIDSPCFILAVSLLQADKRPRAVTISLGTRSLGAVLISSRPCKPLRTTRSHVLALCRHGKIPSEMVVTSMW